MLARLEAAAGLRSCSLGHMQQQLAGLPRMRAWQLLSNQSVEQCALSGSAQMSGGVPTVLRALQEAGSDLG